MIEPVLEALQFSVMRNALLAGLLVSVACGIVGTFVVIKRIVFISGGIAHAAYGGIGLGYYVKYSLLPLLLAGSTATADQRPGSWPLPTVFMPATDTVATVLSSWPGGASGPFPGRRHVSAWNVGDHSLNCS